MATLDHGSYAVTGSPQAAAPVSTANVLAFVVINAGHLTDPESTLCTTAAQAATALTGLTTVADAAAAYAFGCGVPEIVVIVAGSAADAAAELKAVYRKLHRKITLIWTDSSTAADVLALATAAQNIIGTNSSDAFVYADLAWDVAWTDADATTAAAIAALQLGLASHPKNLVWHAAKVAIPDGNSTATIGCALPHVCKQIIVDAGNADIPYAGASNYELPGTISSVSTAFGREDGNICNAAGVNTIIYDDGYKLWGDYLSSYDLNGTYDADGIFVQQQRMLQYLRAQFVAQWKSSIDRSFTRQLRDTIIATEQAKLDRLVAVGALIGNPKIEFLASDNPSSDLLQGHFFWRVEVSPSIPMTSAKLSVAYTDSGYAVLFE